MGLTMDRCGRGAGQSRVWEEATVFEKGRWRVAFLFPELLDEER